MARKILVSYVAFYHDFTDGVVKKDGPTYTLHHTYFSDHDVHLLLSTGKPGEIRADHLYAALQRDFPQRNILLKHLELNSFLDFKEIKYKAEQAIRPYKGDRIEILFSTGSTPMRMSWVLLHLEENGYDTHLLQSLDAQMARGKMAGKAHVIPIEIAASEYAYRLEVRAQELAENKSKELITETLLPAYSRAEKIAFHPEVAILVQGESGTGKELLARHIHDHSARKNKDFIPVNCAALGQELLESRLFGYVKGAFTGADKDQKGYFEAAEGGTIFLDEIGDITPYMQQALLRVLQERRIQRVGANKEIPVNVRVVAATNRNLMEMCEKGLFRWDLYYRLVETEIRLPRLRDYTAADRWQLIQHLLRQKQAQYGLKWPLKFDKALTRWLKTHLFPGNIRELEHVLTNLCIFVEDGTATLDHLPLSYSQEATPSLDIEQVIQRHIVYVYRLLDQNITHTADAVGKSVNTVKRYLRDAGEI